MREYFMKTKRIGFSKWTKEDKYLAINLWGNRYAMEASQCVLQYAFSTLKATKVYAGHHPENRKSTNVLVALGFTYIGDNYYPPTGLMHPSYELTRNSFEIL